MEPQSPPARHRRRAAPKLFLFAGALLALRRGDARVATLSVAGAAAQNKALRAPVLGNRTAPPCAADFSAILPDVPVTEADLRKANYEAFVWQIVEDEDRRVAKGANRMLRRLLGARAARRKKLEEAEALRARASRRKAKAQHIASELISEAVSKALRGVAVQAEAAGRREQLADDQRLIAVVMEKKAANSNRTASSTQTRTAAEGRLADAAETAAMALARDWQVSQNHATDAVAAAGRVAMKTKMLDGYASALATSAAEAATDHISQNIEAYAGMADLSKASVKHAMETERMIGCRDCNGHASHG